MVVFTRENYSPQEELDLYGDLIIACHFEHKIGEIMYPRINGKSIGEEAPTIIIRESSYEEFMQRKPSNFVKNYSYFYAIIAE